ncbi:MAG TPA: type II toxin-antitoxin system VapC family toxin [Actinospica sp.]|nr:type II toxin-antitoxin system VapC family toxin [Actinospica sp.]
MYVLDTNVLSEFRRVTPNRNVLAWIASVPDHRMHLSVVVLGEIRRGARLRSRTDARAGQRLDRWLDELIDSYAFGDRLLPVNLEDALMWGRITADHKQLPEADALIAAQALSRDWTVVTRNVKDFERTGVRLLNPFEYEG